MIFANSLVCAMRNPGGAFCSSCVHFVLVFSILHSAKGVSDNSSHAALRATRRAASASQRLASQGKNAMVRHWHGVRGEKSTTRENNRNPSITYIHPFAGWVWTFKICFVSIVHIARTCNVLVTLLPAQERLWYGFAFETSRLF